MSKEHERPIPEEFQGAVDAWTESIESAQFKHGVSVGESIGSYETYREALRAYELDEIDLWFAFHEPKTLEEWKEWESQHGKNVNERWKPEQEGNQES